MRIISKDQNQIEIALLELLGLKDFNSITVTDIVSKQKLVVVHFIYIMIINFNCLRVLKVH